MRFDAMASSRELPDVSFAQSCSGKVACQVRVRVPRRQIPAERAAILILELALCHSWPFAPQANDGNVRALSSLDMQGGHCLPHLVATACASTIVSCMRAIV